MNISACYLLKCQENRDAYVNPQKRHGKARFSFATEFLYLKKIEGSNPECYGTGHGWFSLKKSLALSYDQRHTESPKKSHERMRFQCNVPATEMNL